MSQEVAILQSYQDEQEDFEEGLYFEATDPLADEDNIIDCGICQSHMTTPKSLPCLHNFCLDCLDRYAKTLSVQDLTTGDTTFLCPLCRTKTSLPEQGAGAFPTNFHVSRLQAQRQALDLGFTLREALEYLEDREEEIVEILQERKRRTLVDITGQRNDMVGKIDRYMESLQEKVRDQFFIDSTKAIDSLRKVKVRLDELRAQVSSDGGSSVDSSGSIVRLKKHAETVAVVADELELLRLCANQEQDKILNYRLIFVPAEGFSNDDIAARFGYVRGKLCDKDGEVQEAPPVVTMATLKSALLSWGQVVFALLPAVIFILILKLYDAASGSED